MEALRRASDKPFVSNSPPFCFLGDAEAQSERKGKTTRGERGGAEVTLRYPDAVVN